MAAGDQSGLHLSFIPVGGRHAESVGRLVEHSTSSHLITPDEMIPCAK